jgi:uncharacterized phage infection (PIP) family protein YhgE
MEFLTSIWFSIGISLAILFSPLLLKKDHSLSSLSGLTTTFGILGTFIGIFIGLLAFQVNDIESSVPRLLEGLKTAFLTSIAGMIAGLILRVRPSIYGIVITKEDSQDGTEAVISLLKTIKEESSQQSVTQNDLLKKIEKALSGDGETTMLTQLQKLRTSFVDKQDELVREFKAFAEKMAENNSKALIDALTEVMKDFNAKINEQFGENFKQLNQAVERILVWQEKYKAQVEQMVDAFDRSLKGVESSEKSLLTINTHAENFTNTAKSLEQIITELHRQKTQIQETLMHFADVAKEAKSAIPIIKDEVNKLTKEFTGTVSATLSEISVSSSKVKDTVMQQSATLSDSQKLLNTTITQITNNLTSQMDRMMKETADRITKQVSELDSALGKELEQSLQSLARQLGSLSTKFVQDYSPLTDRLRELVQMADKMKN